MDLRTWEVVEVAGRLFDHRGRFVLHCHDPEHGDMAMMAPFRTM